MSVCVQALVSLQVVPFAAFGFEQVPVPVSQVPATWHGSLAVQATGFEPVHVPFTHASVCVQAFPSLHAAVLLVFAQAAWGVPALLHTSSVHGLLSLQSVLVVQVQTLAPPTQVPFVQVSGLVQALPSLQVVPFEAFGFEQVPVPGLHVPATWHWSLAVQVTGFAPVQVPF